MARTPDNTGTPSHTGRHGTRHPLPELQPSSLPIPGLSFVAPAGNYIPPGSLLWSPVYSDSHILRGATEIAAVYYGDESLQRHVYYRVQKGRFPHFREGTIGICVRVGTLRRWVEFQEHCAMLGKACRLDELAEYVARRPAG